MRPVGLETALPRHRWCRPLYRPLPPKGLQRLRYAAVLSWLHLLLESETGRGRLLPGLKLNLGDFVLKMQADSGHPSESPQIEAADSYGGARVASFMRTCKLASLPSCPKYP